VNKAYLSKEEIRRRVTALGPWFHNLDLDGVATAPSHFLGDYPRVKWRHFSDVVPTSLKGKTVLDIGCNAGFYAMEMKRRGADRVLGLDTRDEYLAQARFAAEVNGLDVEFRNLSVYDVGMLHESFDLVIFMGVLYHLRHPLLALDLIYEHAAADLMLFQSMQRGSERAGKFDQDYDFWRTDPFDTVTPMIRQTGGFRTEAVPRRCCEAPASSLRLIRSRRCICAGGGSGRTMRTPTWSGEPAHDRSREDMERAEQQIALGS
jgi:tRNA (mo5U34)-methyltransferase